MMLKLTEEQLDWLVERILESPGSPKGGRPVACCQPADSDGLCQNSLHDANPFIVRIVSTHAPTLRCLDAQSFARPESKSPHFTARSLFLRLRIGYRLS